MKIASWNTYGLPTSTLMSLDADINAGKFDVVCMQETHGHEQARKADRTLDAGARLFTAGQPDDADPSSGVAILVGAHVLPHVADSGAVGG